MSYTYILNEIITNNFNYNSLNILSALSVSSGILVIISRNPIVSVLFLIGLFITIASYLMMLGINFIGLSYLLVYVGAVSILFLFILMLINVRISELVVNSSNSIPLAIMISIFFSSITSRDLFHRNDLGSGMIFNNIFKSNSTDGNLTNYDNLTGLSDVYGGNVFFVSSHI